MSKESKTQDDSAEPPPGQAPNERGNWSAIYQEIQNSPGMAHINRTRQRSFSLNIFVINSQELIQIVQQVHDPDEGLRLLSHGNKEVGDQTHREVSRRIHNFAVSALTLVEHTRNFMRENYGQTPVFDRYQGKIKAEFLDDPVSQFVQRLRNYMVHRGLPNSQMYLHMEQDPASGQGATFLTGVRLDAKTLLEWDGWGSAARRYIGSAGEFLDIQSFTAEYTRRVAEFHKWLQLQLDQHHNADLVEFGALQSKLREFQQAPRNLAQDPLTEPPPADDAEDKLNSDASALLGKVRKLELAGAVKDGFRTQRPIGATLSDKDMIGTPLIWGPDVHGTRVFAFILNATGAYGLDEVDYGAIQPLTEAVLKFPWAETSLSRKFIEETTIAWLQASFGQERPQPFSPYLQSKADEAVRPLTLWAPIAHFEIESAFQFGPAEIRPITAEMLGGLESQFIQNRPEDEEEVRQLFNNIRGRMQGFGAVVIEKTCEPERLMEEGSETAKAAVGLLRFLSPAAANPLATTGVALLGKDLIPAHHLIVLGDQSFRYTEGSDTHGDPGMRLPESTFANLKLAFAALGALVRPEGLSQFAFVVRASLLLFGAGLTLSDALERLSYSVSAMEKLLLLHSAEPREFNVCERMRVLLSQAEDIEDNDVALSARKAYRLLARRDLSPLAPHQREAATYFCLNAYHVLRMALSNVGGFASPQEFIGSIDHLRNQQGVQNSGNDDQDA